MQHSLSQWLKKYQGAIITVIVVVAVYAVMFAFGITCPVKHFLGVSCPGCGMTRACFSALRFDFAAAFYYHPLWIVMLPLVASLLFLWEKRKTKAFCAVLVLFFLVLIGVYLYRLFYTETDIVVWEIEKGILSQIISK